MEGPGRGWPAGLPARRLTMETVAFYSYKGGVGRTLLVANTAQFLAMTGRRVVALLSGLFKMAEEWPC